MDEVEQMFEAAAVSRNDGNFESQYKYKHQWCNQDERRKKILLKQKDNRNTKLDKFRGILNLVEAIEEDIFQTPRTHFRPTIYVSGFTKIPNYCDVLMMSEWIYKKPIDFEENWLVVPCPKGTRMLVVAYKGTTKCFNKYGNYKFECRTALPGGSPCQLNKARNTVVLDCFYQEEASTMHVLDILAWNDCVMTGGEAEFRYFWISAQLDEIPDLKIITSNNKLIFKIIPKLPCTKESLNNFLSIFPYYNHNMPPVDGLLFYHKKAQYSSGETPMVGWLYPYMINEVLGEDITTHKGYMLEKPANYTNYINFILTFEARNFRKKQRKIFRPKYNDPEETEMTVTEEENGMGEQKSMETDHNVEEENGMGEQKSMENDHNAEEENGMGEQKSMENDHNAEEENGMGEQKSMENDHNAEEENAIGGQKTMETDHNAEEGNGDEVPKKKLKLNQRTKCKSIATQG